MSTIRPAGRHILIEPVVVERKVEQLGGIYLPEISQDTGTINYIVAALGHGGYNLDGSKVEFTVKVGDKILLNKYKGNDVERDGKNYRIIEEDDILAII